MAERYWIKGVQLGILAFEKDMKIRKRIIKEIKDFQLIGNFTTEEEKADFVEQINSIKSGFRKNWKGR